jgi:signal transduction histidine kinase
MAQSPSSPPPDGRRGLRFLAFPWVSDVQLTPQEEDAYHAERRQQGMENWRFLIFFVVIADLLWWPTDALGYGPIAQGVQVFAIMRAYTLVVSLLLLGLLSWSTTVQKNALVWMGAVGLSVQFVWAYELGRMGPPTETWFIGLSPAMFIPVAVSLQTRSRVFVTFAFGLATFAGYFGFHPQYRDNWMVPALFGYYFFLVALSILAGLYADRLRKESFSFRQKLAKQAVELQLFNEQLDRRVQEATAELRSLTTHLETVRESERAHISRELHDELGQQLTALSLTTSVARARYSQNPANIGALLTQMDSLISRTRTTTRNLVSNLRPQILDDLGFAAGIDWLVRQMESSTGATGSISLPSPTWSPPQPLILPTFRIVQESLTNVARHAQAKRVHVEISEEEDRLHIRVIDDGVGLQVDRKQPGKMGIVGMRERARAMEGEFDITSIPLGGTTVSAWFPLHVRSEGRPS